jgi:pSer/pThr/pTyr-binding forkhead associated (FHA) protein
MTRHIILQELSSGINYRTSLPCVIGRGKESDLSFSDHAISHRHAMIEEREDGLWIQDLRSANGVFVNDQKIKEKALLKHGDSIRLGQTQLLVSLQEAEEDVSEHTVILHSLSPKTEWNLDQKRLKIIYEIATELSENQEVTVLGEKIFSRFEEIFEQDRGYIALFQKDGSLKPLFPDPALKSVPVSRSIVNRMFQNGESFLLEDALGEDAFKEQESILALRIRSALCVPLIFHDQIYGLMYLDRNIPGAYKQDDLEFLRSIALILAPLIENARLWSELKKHYDNAVETLRETESRLIDMERKAAYVRLAHAMAHEIRNPLMVVGGLLRRMARSEPGGVNSDKFQAVMSSVERIEMVLKEVDTFVKIQAPQKRLEKVDRLIHEEIESHKLEWEEKGLRPHVIVNTSLLMVPLDSGLFKKALSAIFKEIMFSIPQGSEVKITVMDCGNELETSIGEIDRDVPLCGPYDSELQDRPWSLSLFLNIAHKIVTDHGGKLLFNPSANSAFPLVIRMPRTVQM